ncbi:MAG: nitroreductase/quinone reductase family protein [Pseudomonadota bacterium]
MLLFDGVYIGLNQAKLEGSGIPMLVITTTDEDGTADSRRLARIESKGKLYVSAHHWWRGWYHRAVANPNVSVEIDGVTATYLAVPVSGAEFDQVAADFPLGVVIRILMGFPPPRDILRLDLV